MRRERDDDPQADVDEPRAKRARLAEARRILGEWGDLPPETWAEGILVYVDSPKELVQLRGEHRLVYEEFPRLMWGLYDRHFRSKITGELALLAQHIRVIVEAETWNEPAHRAMRAYSIMSEAWRATFIIGLGGRHPARQTNTCMSPRLGGTMPGGVFWLSQDPGGVETLVRAHGWRALPFAVEPLNQEEAAKWKVPAGMMRIDGLLWETRDRTSGEVGMMPMITDGAGAFRLGTLRFVTVTVRGAGARPLASAGKLRTFIFVEAFDPDAYWRSHVVRRPEDALMNLTDVREAYGFEPIHPVFHHIADAYGREEVRGMDYIYYGQRAPGF